jgi:hypothetical protein
MASADAPAPSAGGGGAIPGHPSRHKGEAGTSSKMASRT